MTDMTRSPSKLPLHLPMFARPWSWVALASLAWGLGFLYNVQLGGEAHWLKRLYENKVAIAADINEPKLIIAGGSGAHYTVNSDVLSAGINRPVVNLGLDGPLGLDVILASLLETVKPGDTVLLIPEYLILLDDDGYAEKSGLFGVAIGQPGLGGVPPKQLALDVMQLGIPSLRWAVKAGKDISTEGRFTGYYDGPLTPLGDPIETKPREGEWWPLQIKSPATPHAIARIAQFKGEVEAQGGQLVLAMPWIYGDRADPETLASVEETAAALGEIAPLLVDKKTLNIQDSPALFADTQYHLKPEGRELRARQLAQQLQPVLAPAK
jgi:hypothetical protein